MRKLAIVATLSIMAAPGRPAVAEVKSPPSGITVPALRLDDGARSVDALLDGLLKALAARDEKALHRLRVSEREYREIIIPGTVKPGETPRRIAASPSQFFWSVLNQKSEDVGRRLLEGFGGHTYHRGALTFTKGTRAFAWYTTHGDVRLQLEDEHGEAKELRTGAIVEIAGRYKFIGFNSNN